MIQLRDSRGRIISLDSCVHNRDPLTYLAVELSAKSLKIGSYSLLHLIGKGGSSEVFAARGPWDQTVAIKVQRANKKRSRFLQEFDIPNAILHPCFNSIYDYGINTDGRSYLVMDLIEGAVSAVTYAKRFPVKKRISVIIDIGIKVAEALGALHKIGWIHGDIKSKNILIDNIGQTRLIDFELARPIKDTGRGNFFGTRSYAPPEQHEGKKLDQSVDVYALAGVICRMMTGKLPFAKVEKEEQAENRRFSAPVISKAFPPLLRDLLISALDPNPQTRPQNGTEFAMMMREAIGKVDSKATPPKLFQLAELASILDQSKLSKELLPHVHYFSGGNMVMAKALIKQMVNNRPWVPDKYKRIWSDQIEQLPDISKSALIMLAALGGEARSTTLATMANCQSSELRRELRKHPEIVEKNGTNWRLKFGALDSILLKSKQASEILNQLHNNHFLKHRQGRIASAIATGDLGGAEAELKNWIMTEADSKRQWVFLQRLLRWKCKLSKEEKILLCRWKGDWIAAVKAYSIDKHMEFIDSVNLVKQDSQHGLGQLHQWARGDQLDMRIGARAFLAEWRIANGQFHEALKWLKPLCRHKDFYPRNIGLTQRALIHSHLGQRLMSKRVGDKLTAWAVNDDQKKRVERIKNDDLNQNYLSLEEIDPSPIYIEALSGLKKGTPNSRTIRRLAKTLTLQDRASLLCNPIWRPYEKHLALPPSPHQRKKD